MHSQHMYLYMYTECSHKYKYQNAQGICRRQKLCEYCVCVCFVCVLEKFRIHIETCYSSRFTVSLFLTLPENANPGEIELEQIKREDFGNTHIYKELFVHFFLLDTQCV